MTYPSTLYPNAKDTVTYIQVIDNSTILDNAFFAKISSAILAIENELGIKPAGIYSDVRQRLDAMEVGINSAIAAAVSPHSTTIATKFNHNWLSPTIAIPGPSTMVLPTTIGQLSFNLLNEAGFLDGYGTIYFANRIFVDRDCTLEISLWDITSTPTQLVTHSFTYGFHNYAALLSVTIADLDKTYEVRVKQTSVIPYATRIDSVILNSRLYFFPSALGIGDPGGGTVGFVKYIVKDITFSDFSTGSVTVGTVPIDSMIQNTVLLTITPFDTGTVDVGTLLQFDELMQATDTDITISDTYTKESNREVTADTEIIATLTGSPIQGSGRIIVYYH